MLRFLIGLSLSSLVAAHQLPGQEPVRLQISGTAFDSGTRGNRVRMRSYGVRDEPCTPWAYIDGALVQVGGNQPSSLNIDDFVTRAEVAAMEVYARPNAVPPEFAGGSTGCGAIAVWSRRATGKASVAPQAIDRQP